jgi:hypothetical protein
MSVPSTSMGPCGLYCGSCPIFQARFFPELRTRLAKELHCREEQVTCNGCRELTDNCWGRACKIRFCAKNRGYEYCSQCPDLPCHRLRKLSMGYRDLPERQLRELEQMETGEFMKLMGSRWTCPCGYPISAHTLRCIKCGKEAEELIPS